MDRLKGSTSTMDLNECKAGGVEFCSFEKQGLDDDAHFDMTIVHTLSYSRLTVDEKVKWRIFIHSTSSMAIMAFSDDLLKGHMDF